MTRLLMTTDAVGGVWQYSTELARALAPLGIETVLAVMGPITSPGQQDEGAGRGPSSTTIVHTGLPLDWLAADASEVAAAGDAIATLARDMRVDLVQLNSPSLAAQARFPVPVVAVAHGCVAAWWEAAHGSAPAPDYAWHAQLMARGLAAADVVVAPSAAFAATIARLYALPSPPLVVHNGRTVPEAAGVETATGAFTAGRLWDPVKNTALLDQVAALIDTPFRAAGPLVGPHGEAVAVRHLDHLGTLSNDAIARALAGRPIAVSATRFEPFGLSVLEAASAGCPLVLSNIDTFRELWTGAALLVAEETPEAYAAAIARIEGDGPLRQHLGEAARARAARYTSEAMAEAMAVIYAGVLSSSLQSAA